MQSKMDKIGILDPDGINPNPLTGRPYSDAYREEAITWRNLPVYERANEIIDEFRKNQVTVIMAGTGTGKTLFSPKFMLHVFGYEKKIVVTEPRQQPAKKQAITAANTLDVKLGEEVGYRYRGSDTSAYSHQRTILSFVTDGILLREISEDKLLSKYSCVMIDEAHERSVNIDLLLLFLKHPLKERPDFKVVIISATINPGIFVDYYHEFNTKIIDFGTGANLPVKDIYLDYDIPSGDYIRKGIEIVKTIMETDDLTEPGPHDIIFFVTSASETIEMCNKIQQQFKTLFCGELTAKVEGDMFAYITSEIAYKETGKTRKIIVTTNVAESSVTMQGLKFVIDSGYELKNVFNPVTNASVLDRQMISQAQIIQRKGRVGRTHPGVCYHLYTKQTEQKLLKYPKTSISTTNLYSQALNIISQNYVQTADNLVIILQELIEPPSNMYMMTAIDNLISLEMITDDKVTPLGMMISKTGLVPMAGLSLMMAYLVGCFEEVAIILSLIEKSNNMIKSIIREPSPGKDKDFYAEQKRKYDRSRKLFQHRYGDHLSLLKIFTLFNASENGKEFAKENFLRFKMLNDIKTTYKKVMRDAHQVFRNYIGGIRAVDLGRDEKIMLCFAYGYQLNRAKKDRKGYSTDKVDYVNISRDSFFTGQYNDVIYEELFKQSGRFNLNIVSAIPKNVLTFMNKK